MSAEHINKPGKKLRRKIQARCGSQRALWGPEGQFLALIVGDWGSGLTAWIGWAKQGIGDQIEHAPIAASWLLYLYAVIMLV